MYLKKISRLEKKKLKELTSCCARSAVLGLLLLKIHWKNTPLIYQNIKEKAFYRLPLSVVAERSQILSARRYDCLIWIIQSKEQPVWVRNYFGKSKQFKLDQAAAGSENSLKQFAEGITN